jgi:hypothetical protein
VAQRYSNTRTLGFLALALLVAVAAAFSIGMNGPSFILVSGGDSISIRTDTLGRGQVRSIHTMAGREKSFASSWPAIPAANSTPPWTLANVATLTTKAI